MISLYTYRVGLQWFDIGKASASAALTLIIIGACGGAAAGAGAAAGEGADGKRGERLGMAAVWLLLVLAILHAFSHLMADRHLSQNADIFALPPKILFPPTLENYRYNFSRTTLGCISLTRSSSA